MVPGAPNLAASARAVSQACLKPQVLALWCAGHQGVVDMGLLCEPYDVDNVWSGG